MYREDMRPTIVDSFIREFNKHGPKLNLDDVASSIHMSKKTIYRFFRSKQSIYDYILNDASKQILNAQQVIFSNEEMSTKEKLYAITTIKTSWEEKIDLRHMFEIKEQEPEVFEHVCEAFRCHWDFLNKLLEEALKDGTLKPETNVPFILNLFQQGMISLYSTDTLAKSKLTYSDAIEELAKTIFEGTLA